MPARTTARDRRASESFTPGRRSSRLAQRSRKKNAGPRRFAVGPDAVQKIERLDDRVVIGRGGALPISSNLRMFSFISGGAAIHRPDLRDPSHAATYRKPGADRRGQPTCGGSCRSSRSSNSSPRKRKMARYRMCPIHDHFRSPRAPNPSWQICFTGKIWPVRFVMWQMWITLVRGRDRGLDPARQILLRRWRHRECDLLQHDPRRAASRLLPGGESCADSPGWSSGTSSPRCKRQAELDDLERFTRIARDRHPPRDRTQSSWPAGGAPLRFLSGSIPGPHRNRGCLVRDGEVALECGRFTTRRGDGRDGRRWLRLIIPAVDVERPPGSHARSPRPGRRLRDSGHRRTACRKDACQRVRSSARAAWRVAANSEPRKRRRVVHA